MNIRKITSDKKQFLSLLLLADEQESMIDRYIDRGEMFVLDDGGTKAVAVAVKAATTGRTGSDPDLPFRRG